MIDVINLRKSFGDMEVLKGIDITINKGDIVAVIGPSGSGKSTFLRCLNCMEDPSGGSGSVRGGGCSGDRFPADPRRAGRCRAGKSQAA